MQTRITGPENTLRRGHPKLEREFTVDIDPENDTAVFEVGSERFVLATGEWSEWIPVRFNLVGPFKGLSGICRFYLRSVRPYLHLYATPINIDPADPALVISTPDDYATRLQERIGYYYTQGMPEETKALEYGMLSDAEFVSQTENVLDERWRMLDAVLDDYDGGFLFFYVSTIDQSCHAMWRNRDSSHPAHTPELEFADRFEHLYAEMDRLLGVVRSRVSDDATIIVMSDHGFAPYKYKVNLNSWLRENDYLRLIRPKEIGKHALFENVFWRRTHAYAVGINGLYVNLQGREGKGIVRDGKEYDDLVNEIGAKLLAWRHPETGLPVVTRVYLRDDIYHGPEASDGPDIVVGYNRGYRGSDESALGTITERMITPNLGKWTGDHCMDHTLVPGIMLSNRAIHSEDPELIDLPVAILNLYGIERPARMLGRAIMGDD
ncbi:MAG: alkaline phosphatase family protein [Candidatus Krumholzibacteriota bacterium]|nr:alkaline phosphatase family protein [Candidatus Krumholzibacteriota bacterium]